MLGLSALKQHTCFNGVGPSRNRSADLITGGPAPTKALQWGRSLSEPKCGRAAGCVLEVCSASMGSVPLGTEVNVFDGVIKLITSLQWGRSLSEPKWERCGEDETGRR